TAIPTPEPTPILSAVPEITAAPTPVTITITAAGDCTLGGSIHQSTYLQFKRAVQTYGYDYFFSNTRPIFVADDLTIVNLEGPLTDVGSGRKGSYVFKGDPDYVNILTGSSVELCNVANNHSQDFGKEGLERTAEILEAAGIGYCGYTKVFRTEIRGVKISALGYLEWEIDRQKIVDAVKAERPNCDLLIVNMHWGREKHFEPVKEQKTYGYAIIDAGADLIIGTHPHVYGGVEKYKGKYIVYSLGNFCFGGNANPTDKRALLFRQAFTVSPEGEVSDGGVDIIPVSVSGMPKKNDYRPTVMPFADGVKLLQAMSKYSNFSEGFVWLPGSYPEQAGLLKSGVMS
ncbi:MAG: CapA family protein, partial [bacterium]